MALSLLSENNKQISLKYEFKLCSKYKKKILK